MNKTVKLLLVIVSGILVGIMIYSAYNIIEDKVVHSEARSKDNQVVESYVIQNPVSPTPRVYEEQVTNQIVLDDEVSPLNSMVDLSKFFADYKDAVAYLENMGVKVVGCMVGEILTVQEAAGFQLNIAKWDDEIEALWNTPAHATVFFKE